MRRLIVRPEQFVEWFNRVVPGVYRQITVEDVQDMTACDLIKRYGFYDDTDLQTVVGILNFEQLRENRQKKDEIRDKNGAIHCRRCGVVLAKPKAKRGRPSEYCPECEHLRGRERYRKWWKKQTNTNLKAKNGLVTADR